MYIPSVALKKYFLDLKLITQNDIILAEKQSLNTNDGLGNTFISLGKINEEDLQKANAHIIGLNYLNLDNIDIDFETMSLIPAIICQEYNVLAYNKTNNGVEVAMLDTDSLDSIKDKVNFKILPRLTTNKSLNSKLEIYKNTLKQEFVHNIEKEIENIKEIMPINELSIDTPIVNICNLIISYALMEGSHNLYLEPNQHGLNVRFRNNGKIYNIINLPHKLINGVSARIKFLSGIDVNQKMVSGEGFFEINDDLKIKVKTSIIPVYWGEKIIIHFIKENKKGLNLENLGFHGQALEQIHKVLNKKEGVIIVNGPKQSDRTTTLYTMIDMENNSNVNIATLEDPIEMQINFVNQSQVNPDFGLDWNNGLRFILKQDPDILMTTKIYDKDIANMLFNAGGNGQLILSTTEFISIKDTIKGFKQMDLPLHLIASNLKIIINQKLVGGLGNEKEKYFMNDTELIELSKYIDLDRMLKFLKTENIIEDRDTWREVPFYRPNKNEGYSGKVLISETLYINEPIKELILKDNLENIDQISQKQGNLSLLEDGILMSVKGKTSLEEVFKAINQ